VLCVLFSFCFDSGTGLIPQLTLLSVSILVLWLLAWSRCFVCLALRASRRKSWACWASGHCCHLRHPTNRFRGGQVCVGAKRAHSTRSHVRKPVAGSATSEQIAEAERNKDALMCRYLILHSVACFYLDFTRHTCMISKALDLGISAVAEL
jgi:hypothetical protein